MEPEVPWHQNLFINTRGSVYVPFLERLFARLRQVPLNRSNFLTSKGASAVNATSCVNLLKQGPGSAIVIVIGGAQESLASKPGTDSPLCVVTDL